MDINFIIFFIFLIIVIMVIEDTESGMMLIVYAMFFTAIFANTQSDTPLFFANTDLLGWGSLFNTFWLVLPFICIVKSMMIAKDRGILKLGGK